MDAALQRRLDALVALCSFVVALLVARFVWTDGDLLVLLTAVLGGTVLTYVVFGYVDGGEGAVRRAEE